MKYIIKNNILFMRKPNGYWTFERCKEEALKYKTKKEFYENNTTAYTYSNKNKWMSEITRHMTILSQPNGYWTFERCKEEALKYDNKTNFILYSNGAYYAARKHGWLDEICSHMVFIIRPKNYWTFERCKEEALKYDTRKELLTNNNCAYNAIIRNKWSVILFSHMKTLGNKNSRMIYGAIFSDNSVYIGLTYNFQERKRNHLTDINSSVYKYIKEKNIKPNFIKLTDYINVEKAQSLEIYFVNKYKSEGWNILNKAKAGILGGPERYWTFERCKEESLKYKTIKDFRINSYQAYSSSIRYKWLDILCSRMIRGKSGKVSSWTFERCKEEALKYKSRSKFKIGNCGSYNSARKHGWLDEVCSHMK
jgi:predicted GIY-YIG superfamily endonuclease